MYKFVEDSEYRLLLDDDSIILFAPDESSKSILKAKKKCFKVNGRKDEMKRGIFCRNGWILDTVNNKISKTKKEMNFDYLVDKFFAESQLKGKIDYKVFCDFIKYKDYFLKFYGIILYWKTEKEECELNVKTYIDTFGGADKLTMKRIDVLEPKIYINVNEEIISKIKLSPDTIDTLMSFVDKVTIDEYAAEMQDKDYKANEIIFGFKNRGKCKKLINYK